MGFEAVAAALAVAGTAYSMSNQPKMPSIPQAPQEGKTPDVQSIVKNLQGTGQGKGAPGIAQTFLTGSGGIDPNLLNLGRNTLLGGTG